MAGKILIATETGSGTLDDGTTVEFRKGVTRVREGHAIALKYPDFFKELDVHYELEDATRDPGTRRGGR